MTRAPTSRSKSLRAASIASLATTLGAEGTAPDGRDTTWVRSPCLGQCERAPAALVVRAGQPASRVVVAPVMSAAGVTRALAADPAEHLTESLADLRPVVPQAGAPGLALLARGGVVAPTSLEAYRAAGGRILT